MTVPAPASRNMVGGLVCLVCMLIVWETMGIVLQDFTSTYPKFAFITYMLHTGYLVPGLAWMAIRKATGRPVLKPITSRFVLTCLLLALLAYVASYCWYLSLANTLLAANNAIYQSTPFFVFILSIVVLKEKPTVLKVVAFLLCAAGIVLVAIYTPDEKTNGRTQSSKPWAYVVELGSCLAYAFYEVFYAKFMPKNDEEGRAGGDGPLMKGMMVLGVVGLCHALLLWVVVLVVHFTGFEVFEMPSPHQWQLLGVNMVLETAFNVFLLSGIGFAGPVFMAVGGIIIIPAGILVDYFMNHTVLTGMCILGVCLIVCGFLLLEGPAFVRSCVKDDASLDDTLPLLVEEGLSPGYISCKDNNSRYRPVWDNEKLRRDNPINSVE